MHFASNSLGAPSRNCERLAKADKDPGNTWCPLHTAHQPVLEGLCNLWIIQGRSLTTGACISRFGGGRLCFFKKLRSVR